MECKALGRGQAVRDQSHENLYNYYIKTELHVWHDPSTGQP